jgi:uncharacterized membrane protein YhdT
MGYRKWIEMKCYFTAFIFNFVIHSMDYEQDILSNEH